MMNRATLLKRLRKALLSAMLLLLPWGGTGSLLSCSSDDEGQHISGVEASAEAPVLNIYVEDVDGRDLLADASQFSVFCKETGEPLQYSVAQASVWLWQRREPTLASLLSVTLPTPYHYKGDKEYVYTLDPTLAIQIDGLAHPIEVKTFYNYDLRYKQGSGGERTAVVDYKPKSISFGNHELQHDTLHVIAEDGYPYLRVDGDTLHVQLRFPEADDALPTLQWDEDAKQWTGGDLQCRVQLDGRIIAKPHETLSTSRHAEKVVTPEGQVVDSTYRAIDFCMSLPRICSLEGDTSFTYFPIWLFMQSPQLFGDNAVHSVYMVLNQTAADVGQKQMNLWNVYFDGNNSDTPSQYISSPYRINLNWK